MEREREREREILEKRIKALGLKTSLNFGSL
jgi:hypothetical protein